MRHIVIVFNIILYIQELGKVFVFKWILRHFVSTISFTRAYHPFSLSVFLYSILEKNILKEEGI